MMDSRSKYVELKHVQFKHPYTSLVAGPSGSGKTYFIRELLENHMKTINGINKKIIKVAWAYGIWQNIYKSPLKNVDFKYIEGIPEEEEIEGYDIVVIDDLMSEIKNSKFVVDL